MKPIPTARTVPQAVARTRDASMGVTHDILRESRQAADGKWLVETPIRFSLDNGAVTPVVIFLLPRRHETGSDRNLGTHPLSFVAAGV